MPRHQQRHAGDRELDVVQAAVLGAADLDLKDRAFPDQAAFPDKYAAHSLERFFATLAEHAGLYRALLGPQGSARVIDHIRARIAAGTYERLRRTTAAPDSPLDVPHDVPAAFVGGALLGVAADWLQRGCPRSPAEMAALTGPLFVTLQRTTTESPA